ncbi:hypothetical protein [Actinoplanes philippinensis]|uniref:hypothetical protein n=1 Tax=Actinoplanes philippinensis TaxID=35752 RepID=UPI0033C9DA85
MAARHVWATALALLLTGCGTAPAPPASAPAVTPSRASPSVPVSPAPSPYTSLPPSPTVSRTASAPASRATPSRTARSSADWEITVYYTAVEEFHDGEPRQVAGCRTMDCSDGDDDLGTYPADFVDAVHDEGTGRTASGRYLNWSYDTGFWIDSAPRTSSGGSLIPFVSAAADPGVLPRGTRFTVAGCGSQEDGSTAPRAVCAALRDASWTVTDEFTPGLGGPKHLDAYIGEETGPGFTDSQWYLTLTGARLQLR